MSWTAVTVPRTRSGDLRPADARRVRDIRLDDPPARRSRTQDHLQRVAAASIADAESLQRLGAGDPHRPDVGHVARARLRRCAARGTRWQPARATARRSAASGRGGRGRGRRRRPSSATSTRQFGGIERGIGIAHRDDRRRRPPRSPPRPRRRIPVSCFEHDCRAGTRARRRPSRRSNRCRRRSPGSPAAPARAPRAAPPPRSGKGGRDRRQPWSDARLARIPPSPRKSYGTRTAPAATASPPDGRAYCERGDRRSLAHPGERGSHRSPGARRG